MGKRGPKKGTKYKKENIQKVKVSTVKKPDPLPIETLQEFDELSESGSLFTADEPKQDNQQIEDKTLEYQNTAVQMTVGLFNTLSFIPNFRKLKDIKESDIYCREALGRQYGKHLSNLNSDEADYIMIAVCFGGIVASAYEGNVKNESSTQKKQYNSDTGAQGAWKDYPVEQTIREI